MNVGDLIKVNGRLATVARESYTRMVYDSYDHDLSSAGYEGGTACGFVDVVFSDTGKFSPVNLSRSNWSFVK